MNFKMFEESNIPQTVYVREPQGMLRKSASVKIWDKIGVGKAGDGFGVYAIDDIKDNETIEECPVIEMTRDEFNSKVLMDYMFKISQDRYVLALGSGCIYNHRNEPNARWEYVAEQRILKIVSTRPIEMGEEIYISYGREYFKTREQNMKA
jgi:SET domain-containing protein